MPKFKCDVLRNFQTMWIHGSLTCVRFVAHIVIYVVVSENTPYSNISGILQDRPKMQFGSLVIGNVVSRWYVKCKHPLSISLSRHVVIHLGREAKKEGEQSIILWKWSTIYQHAQGKKKEDASEAKLLEWKKVEKRAKERKKKFTLRNGGMTKKRNRGKYKVHYYQI